MPLNLRGILFLYAIENSFFLFTTILCASGELFLYNTWNAIKFVC